MWTPHVSYIQMKQSRCVDHSSGQVQGKETQKPFINPVPFPEQVSAPNPEASDGQCWWRPWGGKGDRRYCIIKG